LFYEDLRSHNEQVYFDLNDFDETILASATTDDLKRFAEDGGWQNSVLGYARQYSDKVTTYYNEFLEDSQTVRQPVFRRNSPIN
jgi:hypothetical protein